MPDLASIVPWIFVVEDGLVLSTWQETILQLFGKRYETAELNFVLGIPGVTTMERLGAENPKEFDEV